MQSASGSKGDATHRMTCRRRLCTQRCCGSCSLHQHKRCLEKSPPGLSILGAPRPTLRRRDWHRRASTRPLPGWAIPWTGLG
eukprot:3524605-Rhodomonas_salina.2